MRSSIGVHGAPAMGARKRFRSVVCGALLILTTLVATACGSASSASTPSLPDGSKAPLFIQSPANFWFPGVFIVAAISNDGGLQDSGAQQAITQAVKNIIGTSNTWKIQELAGAADSPQSNGAPPALIVFDHIAVASYQLVSTADPSKVDVNEVDLATAVNTINDEIGKPKPELNPNIKISPSAGTTIWLAGATPDLLGMGGGLDHVGGSPGSGPVAAEGHQWQSRGATVTCATKACFGAGKIIDILDTYYSGSGSNPAQLCLASPTPPTSAPPTPTVAQVTPQTAQQACPFLALNVKDPFPIVSPDTLDVAGYPYGDSGPDSFARHGQFIAKIIQYNAPLAGLNLIPVLNTKGAADLRSLIYGLHEVFVHDSPVNTLVSMSLTLQPPTTCLPDIWHSPQDFSPQTFDFEKVGTGENTTYYPVASKSQKGPPVYASCSQKSITTDPTDSRLYAPIGLVIQQLRDRGYTMVAAAGNDSHGDPYRLGASMPAAFCHVVAVAATNEAQAPTTGAHQPLAPYSNAPSLNGECIETPTGYTQDGSTPLVINSPLQTDTSPTSSQYYATGSDVCSLYLGNPKSGDMAKWSGSSFAVPFVTAHLAASYAIGAQPC